MNARKFLAGLRALLPRATHRRVAPIRRPALGLWPNDACTCGCGGKVKSCPRVRAMVHGEDPKHAHAAR